MVRLTGLCTVLLSVVWALAVSAQATRAPRIWDDQALADWATPVAGLNVRPAHFSAAEYYGAPLDNLRTYPVYAPDREPAGYWDELQNKKPEPLVDASRIRTDGDWIAAGHRAFREMDLAYLRTADPALIAQARNPVNFQNAFTFPDGSIVGLRWVVTDKGVMLSGRACAACHIDHAPDGSAVIGGPGGSPRPPGVKPFAPGGLPLVGAVGTAHRLRQFYTGDNVPTAAWREFTVPWAVDERIEAFRTMKGLEFQQANMAIGFGRSFGDGVFARTNGSPFAVAKIVDLHTLRYSRYVDATGTHRLRGPEDVARYAALVTGADPMEYGPHKILTPEQRRVRLHYADETLYAIGKYLLSLEPPKNPNPPPADLVARGSQIFSQLKCGRCHEPPNYTSGKLTLAAGFTLPANHPNRADVLEETVGTDSDTALKTRKGTGLYKIPSLRGVWYRPRLLHDGALTSLEEMFEPARLGPEYERKGWTPPGVTKRAVPGHTFGLNLDPKDKAALIAFLRSL